MDNRIVRGSWQESIFGNLLAGHIVRSPHNCLAGKAASYQGRYSDSFYRLLSRARAAGYIIIRCEGSRGGEWSATYKLLKSPSP